MFARVRPLLRVCRAYSTELSSKEEELLAHMRKAMETNSFVAPDEVDMSPELRTKVNDQFNKFVEEFALGYGFDDEVYNLFKNTSAKTSSIRDLLEQSPTDIRDADGNMTGGSQFPRLDHTDFDVPYSAQERFVRQLFHAQKVANVGAAVTDVYRPHEDIFKPKTASNTSIQTLIAAGAHLGHHTSRLRPSTLQFVYGVRQDIHIIDLNQTLTYLKRAANVAEGIAERGGIVLFVGTRPGQERSVELAAERSGNYYVHTKWMPGTLSNAEIISGWDRHEVDMGDKPTNRPLDQTILKSTIKPDLVVILNPVENRTLLRECINARVPTVGVIDTDSEPSLVTYPIPANDDSLRATDLIVGVLSNAAKRGRERRLKEMGNYRKAEERAQTADFFNKEAST